MTLTLVPWAEAHFPALAGWFPDAASLVQWAGPGLAHPLDPAAFAAALPPPPGEALSALAADGTLAGHAQLFVDADQGLARLARVAVAPSFRGRGVAAPMLAAVIGRAFGHPWVERLELHVFAWNEAAIRLYRRLGFVHEGTRRAAVRVGAARWDTAVMGLLRRDRDALGRGAGEAAEGGGSEIAHASSAAHYTWGEGCDGWILAPGRDLQVIEERMPPGIREVRHRHGVARQVFYVLDGALTLEREGRVFRLGPRAALEVPPGAAHQARNEGQGDVRFLVISAPTSRGDRHPSG